MRNMSFAMTTDAILEQRKTVTRRFGWRHLKPGELVQPVRKAMGLKKGEKVERLGSPIRIISTRREPLNAITADDVVKEGFPGWMPAQFVDMLCEHYGCEPQAICTRIEFEYVGSSHYLEADRDMEASGDA